MSLTELHPGNTLDAIPGSTWNRHNAATRFVEAWQGDVRPESPNKQPRPLSYIAVSAVNDTEQVLEKGQFVSLQDIAPNYQNTLDKYTASAPSYDVELAEAEVFGGHIWLRAVAPDADAPLWGVVQKGGDTDATVRVAISGVCAARVDVTDADHTHVQYEVGTIDYGVSGTTGARIIEAQFEYKASIPEPVTGEQWCVIHIAPAPKPDLAFFTATDYDAGAEMITVSTPMDQLPSYTPAIADEYVWDRHAQGFAPASTGYAVYSEAVTTYDPGGGAVPVNWIALPMVPGDAHTVNVKLYNNVKQRATTSCEVHLLDASLSTVGDPVTCHDPTGEFSAGLAEDAIGRATLVRDADTNTTRLEFTHLRGPAAWVCATLDEDMGASESDEANATVDSYAGPDWQNEDPADGSGNVTVLPCSGMHENLQEGDKVVAVLKDPDTDPLEYLIVEANGSRETLIAKVTSTLPARTSDNYGSVSCALGHPVAGIWTQVLAAQTVYNPSSSPVTDDYDDPHVPVALINGQWVALNATDLHQVSGWTTANDQAVAHDADTTTVEWQDLGDCEEE